MKSLICAGLAALLGGCGAAEVPNSQADATAAEASVPSTDVAADAAGKDVSAKPVIEPDAADKQALQLLLTARTAAAKTVLWPGYGLATVPIYAVRIDAKSDGIKGWLIGWSAPPKGAFPIQDADLAGKVWRYDAEVDAIHGESWNVDLSIAATSTFAVTYTPETLANPEAWLQEVGVGYMERLRNVEAQWFPVAACGQTQYPRNAEAIALLFLECGVLSEAYQAPDVATATQRLREWYAIRTKAGGLSALILKRIRHYDNQYGPDLYTARHLLLAVGLLTQTQLDQRYLDELKKPASVPVADFDNTMLGNGWSGAVALEVAVRLGWDVDPIYRASDSVYLAIPAQLGTPPASLVDDAKKRHDWAAFTVRADQIMAWKEP